MKYLITGGCGFLGSNLASEVLARGEDLFVFDNLCRTGSEQNLAWLRSKGLTNYIHGDIRLYGDIERAIAQIKPDVIFHLAGQVAMTTSLDNPFRDFQINTVGSINMLESVRTHAPNAIVIYSSTNKVYGDLECLNYEETTSRYIAPDYTQGFDENLNLDFRSPYGCSKGAADQYMLDYARNFGLRTIVFRHSSIFGGRQFSTYDQGWIGWFIKQALDTKKAKSPVSFTVSGDGKQVRDVLFASDLVRCYFDAVAGADKATGNAFNIGGGMINSLSLLELFTFLEKELEVELTYTNIPWRKNDQKVFVADTRKSKEYFGWSPLIQKERGIQEMIEWVKNNEAN
jgi:CDP-paratose 2-epimerase